MRAPGQAGGAAPRPHVAALIVCAALLVGGLAGAGCSSTRTPDSTNPDAPAPHSRVVVSPTGDDEASGDDAHPFRTLGRAVAHEGVTAIDVLPGTYTETLTLTRDVELTAREQATLDGVLTVREGAVSITRLDLGRGLLAERTPRLALTDLRVSAAPEATEAARLTAVTAVLRGVSMVCGSETCLETSGSTLSIERLRLTHGATAAKRGLRAETSSVTIRGLVTSGASNVDVQVNLQSHLTLLDAELVDVVGNALAVQGGSTLTARRLTIRGTSRVAVLLSASDADVRAIELGPLAPSATGLGIEGGRVTIADSRFVRAGGTAIAVNDHRTRPADVRLERVVIDHGRGTALNHGQGQVTLSGSTLRGDEAATTDGEDSVTVSGETADLVIEDTSIDASTAYAVGVYNNAGARISARITRPRLGGVLFERTAGADLRLTGTTITDCKQGSGVAVVDALGLEADQLEVQRCPEAGLLVGAASDAVVRRSRFVDNRQYGLAAFGRSTITLSGSEARGSKWVAFASCADGSVITDGGGNTLTGAKSLCP